MKHSFKRAASCLVAAMLVLAAPASAQDRPARVPGDYPPEAITSHRITLPSGPLDFRARAGAVRLDDPQSGAPVADVTYVSFEANGADPTKRPVFFAINGGPGAGAAWLGLGAIGPWRIRIDPGAGGSSAIPQFIDNADTWLPFTDIVLVDPPGGGYGRLVTTDDATRRRLQSVDGDVDMLAVFIRKWLISHDRLASPKFIVAESYGGIRAPRVVHILSQRENIGIRGMQLISPALKIDTIEGESLAALAAYLPSYAAVTRNARERSALEDVETYASSDYIVDLIKGPHDAAAQTRLANRVSAITGLQESVVRQTGGRIDRVAWSRDRDRAQGRVLSLYDGTISGFDPSPLERYSEWDDPMLDTLRSPLGSAMTALVTQRLKWPLGDARYITLNDTLLRQWDWGRGGRLALESTTALRMDLALDPALKVTILHGLTDFVTPYFATKMILDQLPTFGMQARIKFLTFPGGHMIYTHDEGRRAMRDEAHAMIEGAGP
jgi:carboxypeptidase C (cathepsin A)